MKAPREGFLDKFSFLCPNGTVFNQEVFACDWWFNVDCAASVDFYFLNEEVLQAMEEANSSSREGRALPVVSSYISS